MMIRLKRLIMLMLICISFLSISARSEDPASISIHNLDLMVDKTSVLNSSPTEIPRGLWENNNSIANMNSLSERSNANLDPKFSSSNSKIESDLEILDKVAENPISKVSNSDTKRYLKILYDQAADRVEETDRASLSRNYDVDRNIRLLYESDEKPNANFNVRIASSNANLESNLKNLGKEVLNPVVVESPDTSAGHYLKRFYEQTVEMGGENDYAHANQNYEEVDSNIRYLYKSQKISNANSDIRIASPGINIIPNREYLDKSFQVIDRYNKLESDLNYISKTSNEEPDQEPKSIDNARGNLNYLIQSDQLTARQSSIPPKSADKSDSYLLGNSRLGANNAHKKYAIIVGINDYSYTRSLGTSVNDANEIENVLKKYGYETIKLTDDTDIKPTKYNILKGALAEIGLKQGGGNIIFYFSGHAEKDDKGNLYLLPQDANGDSSSYINGEELKRTLKSLKNLAIIIDACNSGGLNYKAENGQMILTSSKEDESSNEDWLSPFSMFTHQLCNAINEEAKFGGKISLERCFDIARADTIKLSRSYLLSQTPMIIDKTGGKYYLN